MTGLVELSAVLLLLAAPVEGGPALATVQPGETLAQVAKRTLGDPKAASELQAYNALPSAEVTAGTQLKLPGHERDLALSALQAARNAVTQANGATPKDEATRKLAQAEELFGKAKYPESAQAADGAWQLVSARANEPTRFTVNVADSGKTQVKAHSGKPVRVEAQGVARAVYAGQTVDVEKGQAPQRLEEAPAAPVLVAPAEDSTLKLRSNDKGVGPLLLSWKAVEGAKGYEVEVERAEGNASKLVLKSSRAELRISSLPAGRYLWAVRALGERTRSELSGRRQLELVKDAMKLEVKGASWK